MSPRLTVGEIFRWSDADHPIPGTEGITLGPDVVLDMRDLSLGEFRHTINADNNWARVGLHGASFVGAILTRSEFSGADLTNVTFSGADLTRAHFGGDPVASAATLIHANFSNAKIGQADLYGITREQLYATYGYKVRDLAEISFGDDLQDWKFDDQNVSFADFRGSLLNGATFRNADLVGADFIFSNLTGVDLSGA
jgi:uncharacterized protein YjbI with pentapeptide repeats